MTFPQNVQFRVFVSRFYQSTRRVRGDDREAIGANHKASRDWGILNRLDLCSPGLRFRRFLRPRGSNFYAYFGDEEGLRVDVCKRIHEK